MAIKERYVTDADGVVYHVQLIADVDAIPDDYECYDADQRAAWFGGQWQFVGLVVRVRGFHDSAGLWAIEYGSLDGVEITFDDIMAEHLDALKDDAVAMARAERDRLNRIPLH